MQRPPHDIAPPWQLACSDLCVERGGRPVLREIRLTLRDGDCLALIGPNGSGKTTLMLAMLGLLPAAAGRVTLNGRPLATLSAARRGRFASYVPQTIERLPAFCVYDVVAMGRFPHGAPLRPLSTEDRRHVADALRACGLEALAGRRVDTLSGGERQKTLIAAAIAQDPQVMFLDEPNTALDPGYQAELVALLQSWHRSGRALVVISHDLQLPAALGGRVVAVCDGRIAADGTAADVLSPERLEQIYGARFATATTADGHEIVVPSWWRRGD